MWKIRGHDTFSNEPYSLPGEWTDEDGALLGARERLQELERTQPASETGGQDENGIQDKVYIIRPDGTEYPFLP